MGLSRLRRRKLFQRHSGQCRSFQRKHFYRLGAHGHLFWLMHFLYIKTETVFTLFILLNVLFSLNVQLTPAMQPHWHMTTFFCIILQIPFCSLMMQLAFFFVIFERFKKGHKEKILTLL